MTTIPLRTKAALRYNQRNMVAGETFDALSEKDARLLVAIGKAEHAPAGGQVEASGDQSEAKPSEEYEPEFASTQTGRRGRGYNRRDMRPKE